jgi:hypothetical protein
VRTLVGIEIMINDVGFFYEREFNGSLFAIGQWIDDGDLGVGKVKVQAYNIREETQYMQLYRKVYVDEYHHYWFNDINPPSSAGEAFCIALESLGWTKVKEVDYNEAR